MTSTVPTRAYEIATVAPTAAADTPAPSAQLPALHRATDLALTKPAGRRGLDVQALGLNFAGLGTIGGFLAMGMTSAALVAVGVTAAANGAVALRKFLKTKGSVPLAVPPLSTATRTAIEEGVKRMRDDGVAFVLGTENNSRYGGTPLPPVMVLTALTTNGELHFGPSRRGDRNTTVWSQDALRIDSVEALCQVLNVKIELESR